ncbi:histidine phosphatase family protein [Pseudomonas putida]|uniref:Histidine phosphatase family protein n=1 Tax=Pseudomonas putida TaxID=303 RepID=A0A1Q9QZ60_PSEPU|nr:histidine phosphatase family protein [Pseudomonas putida]OLS60450.1 hypothetical protein PSEMO_48610 [Pseudomonas putida]
MKSTTLSLICHAPTEAQRVGRFPGADETPRDVAQVRLSLPVADHVLVAPELRARQTAEALGLRGQVDDELRDCDFGRWQGMLLKHLEAQEPEALQQWLGDPCAAPHDGESIEHVCQRVARWVEGMARGGSWQVVTHPMVVRAALIHVLGCPLDTFHRIDVPPLSVVQLSHYGRWRFKAG